MQTLTTAQYDVLIAEKSFYDFVLQAWDEIVPFPFVEGMHIRVLCDHLQAVTEGRIKNLIINLPPRHSKSVITNVMWPAWEWAREPRQSWIYCACISDLAIRDSMDCRRLVESDWYKARWPDVVLTGDQNVKSHYQTTAGGGRKCFSVGGKITGAGAMRRVIDDPIDAGQSESDAARAAAIWWYDNAFKSRIADPKRTSTVLIMQRTHEEDLTGHILATEPGKWDHLCLPGLGEPEHPLPSHTTLGFVDKRKEGELLWPERFDLDSLNDLASTAYARAGQIQQRPSPAEGGRFKRQWFRTYTRSGDGLRMGDRAVMLEDCYQIVTADLALSTKETADYTAIGEWAVTPEGDLILLRMSRLRAEAPDVERMLKDLWDSGRFRHIGVEKAHYGMAVIQSLKRQAVVVKELKVQSDKLTRSIRAQVMAEGGKVWVPSDADWIGAFLDEVCTFPAAKHDDQVDALSHAAEAITFNGIYIGGDEETGNEKDPWYNGFDDDDED